MTFPKRRKVTSYSWKLYWRANWTDSVAACYRFHQFLELCCRFCQYRACDGEVNACATHSLLNGADYDSASPDCGHIASNTVTHPATASITDLPPTLTATILCGGIVCACRLGPSFLILKVCFRVSHGSCIVHISIRDSSDTRGHEQRTTDLLKHQCQLYQQRNRNQLHHEPHAHGVGS
jgi:hypothetical protein